MGTHAILSPSAAKRWLNCTAAPRLEEKEPESSSTYAEEGTLAHAYCALKLKKYLGLPTDGEEKEIKELNEKYHTGEMDEYTDTYVTIVLEKLNAAKERTRDACLLVETRLDFSSYIPDAFGTADAIIIADGVMEVIDFKYGKGVKVDAHENPQMMIYALGAYDAFNFEYNINAITMTIVQPRIDNLSEYTIDAGYLLAWTHNVLVPKAKEAYAGNGDQTPGEWCQFCKVKAKCAKLANDCIEAYEACADMRLLTPEQLATDVLPKLKLIGSWAEAVSDYALEQAKGGVSIPGYKLVEGRSVRKITDQDGAAVALNKAGYNTAMIYKPQELRTITDLEKLVGKKQFAAICGDFIYKPAGSPTLVPESDKRATIKPENDFKDIDIDNA